MARPLRIEYAGALYHITSRGNSRGRIFLSDHDKNTFLDTLHLVIKRYGWKCYAYCLMDNHYHLLIETPAPNLSLGMRLLNGSYTQCFNIQNKRTGHVFQGRFKAFVVEKQNYLMALSAYIVLNPVRAKIFRQPNDWQWSSYSATVGKVSAPEWLDTSYIMEQFGDTKKEAVAQYGRFVAEQAGQKSPCDDAVGQVFVGGETFLEEMRDKIAEKYDQIEIPRDQRHADRPALKGYFDGIKTKCERNDKIIKAHIKYGYKQAEIARHLGLHYVTVSKVINAERLKC